MYRSSSLRIHVNNLLRALRDHIITLFAFEFKTARAAHSLPVDHPDREVENIVMPQWMQKADFGLTDHPEHVRVLAVVRTPTDRCAPIPGSFDQVPQNIRRADGSAGVQFPPAYTECTGKDFRHGAPQFVSYIYRAQNQFTYLAQ